MPGLIRFRGSRVAFFRGPRTIYWGGIMRRLVVLSAIGTVYYGTSLYYPVGYVALAQPVCSGQTEEGCALTWRNVPTEDGASIPQCVQFCPQGVQPSVQTASVSSAAVQPTGNEGGCEVKGYAQANLQGESFQTSDNYPTMDQWKQAVASLEVVSGTWDFYSDDNYGGEAIRLTPGVYRTLGDNWTSQISSFMCAQPGGSAQDSGQQSMPQRGPGGDPQTGRRSRQGPGYQEPSSSGQPSDQPPDQSGGQQPDQSGDQQPDQGNGQPNAFPGGVQQ